MIDTVFIERVISKLAFNYADVLELLNVPLDGRHSFRVSSTGILEPHRYRTSSQDTRVNAGNSLIVYLRDIVDQIVLLMYLF